jgi:molecular chaperone DnaK (HSP70)
MSSTSLTSSTVAIGIDLGSWNARVATFDEALNHPVLIHNRDGHRSTRVQLAETDTVTAANLQAFIRQRVMHLATDAAHTKELNVITSIPSEEAVDAKWLTILKKFGGVITEAAAVCLAYDDVINPKDGQKILILDGGASGLKATLLQNKNGLLSRQASQSLSAVNGTALVDALAQSAAQQFEQKNRFPRGEVWESKKAKLKLQRACEAALKTLQINNTVTIHVDGLYEGVDCQVSISKPKWDHLSSKLAAQAKQFLSQLPEADLVLMSGNLHNWLKPIASGIFKEKLVSSPSIDPSEAVALGCARQAYLKLSSTEEKLNEPTMEVQVAPISIGIKKNPEEEVTMIDRGTPLPAMVTHTLEGSSSIELWQLQPQPKQLATLADLDDSSTLKLHLSQQGKLKIWVNGESLVIG